jgi:ketosteroid isomerase-like protein
VTHGDLRDCIEAYERAWRTAGTQPLSELFAADATYAPAPYDPVLTGLAEIAKFWEAEREGSDEPFGLTWESVAVQGETAVARVEVHYDPPHGRRYRDLWIVTLDERRLATAFEEWPFFPGLPRTERRS